MNSHFNTITADDVAAAIQLVSDMHFIPASRIVANLLNINLAMAYDLIRISRLTNL